MSERFDTVLNALRGAAEPTRLRLIQLLTHGELTVGEISTVLDQSQPRISRHLKMMCDAGLLDRFREEHWVYYRVPSTGIGHVLAMQAVELLDPNDGVLLADQRRMANVLADRIKDMVASTAANPKSQGEVHDRLVDELAGEPIGDLLDIGTGTGQVLSALGINAARAIGIDISTEALRIARTRAHTAGLSHCLFRRGDMYGLPFGDQSFDTVTIDRVLATAARPKAAVAEAARILRKSGRLCLIEDFDALAKAVDGNPLTILRDWFLDAGLECARLRPLDTESGHSLIAIARPKSAQRAAA